MTPNHIKDIEKWLELGDKATQGTWQFSEGHGMEWHDISSAIPPNASAPIADVRNHNDANFILAMRNALPAIKALLEEVKLYRWIPTIEQLPRPGQLINFVLKFEDNEVYSGRFNERFKVFESLHTSADYAPSVVRCWMPLPNSPEVNDDQ